MEKRLSGGYIQLWLGMNKDATWKGVVSEMKSLGMNTIIIQYMSSGVTFCESVSSAAMILKYAHENDMKVFLGLSKGDVAAGSSASIRTDKLRESKKECEAVACMLKKAFKDEPAFYGWHIPLESWMSNYDETTTANLHDYYKELTAELKRILPKKVLISPFVNKPNEEHHTNLKRTTPERVGIKYTKILQDTGIDFLALQDGVGAEYISVSEPNLPKYFAEMCDACKANNIELWANVESFKKLVLSDDSVKRTAADIQRFEQQLAVAQGSSRIVTFDFFHYMNIKNILLGTARPDGYEDAVGALNEGYKRWLAARETTIESESC
ncbi:MAG: DUF4434 domain-containing protein [Candidatus Electrothrix sp. AR4]|nr:DUF4434 domain-containing protein [Candidatus Electrothrix sp. AR4]